MIYILDRSEKIVGFLQNRTDKMVKNIYFEDLLTEDLATGSETYAISSLCEDNTAKYLEVGNYIAFKKNNYYKLLQIIETDEDKEEVLVKKIYCETAGMELLGNVYRGGALNNVNIRRFLENVLQDTHWKVGNVDENLTTTLALELEEKEVYSLIQENISKFNAEIEFRVDIKGNKIVGRYIDVYSTRGKYTGKRLEITKDINKISRKIDIFSYATKLIGVGKDGLSFKDIQAADKPLGQNFIVNQKAYETLNNKGSHITRVFEYDTTDANELLLQTRKALEQMSQPQVTYEIDCNIVDIDVEIGDTLIVSDMSFNPPLTITTRVGKLETSRSDRTLNKATLTNFKEIKSGITKYSIGTNDIIDGAITQDKIDNVYTQTITTEILEATKIYADELFVDTAKIKDLEAINATIENLTAKDAQIENLVANKATIKDLEALKADINELEAGKADIEILDALKADIEVLEAGYAKIEDLDANKANIEDLQATNAQIENLKAKDANIENLIANKASINELNAVKANINSLVAKDAQIENLVANKADIDQLDAINANIGTLTTNVANIDKLVAKKADIGELNATNAKIENLKADYAELDVLISEKASIDDLRATNASIDRLQANKADITQLNAASAEITNLKANVAEIDTLLAGNITSENIASGTITAEDMQTGTITAGSGVIAEGAIGNAQISSVDAGKINAGTVDTSKVTIQGANGHLKIKGNRLQVFSGIGSSAKERVSLGDVNGNGSVYGLRVRGADGTTILLDENGVTSEGITDGSISNEKISDDANIDGAKLNINSVVSKINEDGTEVIKGTKIEVDGTTLTTKLSNITTKQTENSNKITQAQTQIKANENAIKLKVDTQTYQTDKNNTQTLLNKHTSEISALQDEIALKVDRTGVEEIIDEVSGELIDSKIDTAKAEIKVTTDKISQNVTNLTNTVSKKADGSTVTTLSNKVGTLETSVNGISGKVTNLETTTTTLNSNVTKAQNTANTANSTANSNKTNISNLQGEVNTVKSDVASLEVTTSGISQKVSNVESTTATLTTKVNTAQSTADSAKTTANTANTQATTNKNNISSLTTSVNNTNTKVASLETNLNSVTSRVSATETNLNTTTLLAKAMSNGKVIHTDIAFRQGVNGVYLYNNSGNGTVTVSRIAKPSDCPTTSTHCLEIKTTGTASPGNGGFYQGIQSRANAIFIQKFIAKVPSGLTLNVASNSMGTGYTDKWLTSNKGTGKWEEYIREVRCGSTGTFSGGGHVYVSGASPTSSSPLVWYLGSCTAYDITDTDERITNLTTRVSTAESKLTKESLTTTIGNHYTTSTDVNGIVTSKGYATTSQVTQTTNALSAKFSSSGGYNLLRNSTGANGTIAGWTHNGTSMGTSPDENISAGSRYYMYLDNGTTTGEKYAFSSRFKLLPNKVYRFTGYFHNYTACTNFDVFVLGSTTLAETDTSTTYDTVTQLISTQNTNGSWKKYTLTFTTPANIKSGYIRIDNNGYNSSGSGNNRIHWHCLTLTEGELEVPWSPHPSEVYDGITTIDKNGVKVSQSNYNGYTQMKADGFYVNNGSENVISVTSSGATFKGKVTIQSGSLVPTSTLSGTISSSQLNSTITNDISTAKSNASTALSTANTAKSTADTAKTNAATALSTANTAKSTADSVNTTVNNGKTNWNNAYNRVNQWAYGAVTVNTTIDGGHIQTNTIVAEKIALGDFTNYAELNANTLSKWGWTSVADSNATSNPWFQKSSMSRDNQISKYYTCNGGESLRVKADIFTSIYGQATNGGTATATARPVGIMIFTINADGTRGYICNQRITAASTSGTTGTVNNVVTLPTTARQFAVYVQTDGYPTFTGVLRVRNVQVTKMSSGELIVDGAITAGKISSGAITTDKLGANAVTAAKIAANTITASQIASGAIATDELAANAVTAAKIAVGTITADRIASRTITADRIKAGAITANEIAAGTITADKIKSGAITADMITTGTLNASKINVTNLNASNITSGTISGDRIKGGTLSAANEINFIGGARIFGNTGAYDAGLTISAQQYNFNSGEAYFEDNLYARKNLTVTSNIKGASATITGTASIGNVNTNGLNVYGSTSLSGALYTSGAVTIGSSLSVKNSAIYGMNNLALSRSSLYIPNFSGNITMDYLRIGAGFVGCTDGGVFHIITNNASRNLQLGSGQSLYLPHSNGYVTAEMVRLGAGIIATPSSGSFHFITASGATTPLYAGTLYSRSVLSVNESEIINEESVFDKINSINVISTSKGLRLHNPASSIDTLEDSMEVIKTSYDKEKGEINTDIDYTSAIATLWKAVQELKKENQELKNIYTGEN